MSETEFPKIQQSERFCAPDSDVTFQSSDGMHFKVHRKNLEVHSDGFPPSDISTQGEVVPLSENSATLDLLFQFVYPRIPDPNLTEVEFPALIALAEAAEKYQIYSAMASCSTQIRKTLPNHPISILNFAGKHNYADIVDLAAPLTVKIALKDVVDRLAPNFIIPWIKYYGEWVSVLTSASSWPPEYSHRCDGNLGGTHAEAIARLNGEVASLANLEKIFKSPRSCCLTGFRQWFTSVDHRVRNIPKFSTFLYPTAQPVIPQPSAKGIVMEGYHLIT